MLKIQSLKNRHFNRSPIIERQFMDLTKFIRREYLLDELSQFVSSKGIIQTTYFSNPQTIECPKARSLCDGQRLGAGIDLDLTTAMIKSMAEALERWSFLKAKAYGQFIRNKSIKDMRSLGYSYFYPPYDLYEDFVYKNHPHLKRISSGLKLDWSKVRRFRDNEWIWFPASYIYSSQQNKWTNVLREQITSNGMSCSFFDSAVEASILELIERDAFLYMWLAKSPGEEVVFDEVQNKALRELLDKMSYKLRQIKVIYKRTDTKIPCFFVIFRGEKKYNEPAFFISGSADMNIERGCYKILLEFLKIYNGWPDSLRFYKKSIKKLEQTNFTIKGFTDRTAYYTMFENFCKCEFLFNVKGQKKLSSLVKEWKGIDKKAFLRDSLKGKDIFTADMTPKEIAQSDVAIVRSYSPDLLDLEGGEIFLFNSLFKKKRVDIINKALKQKTKPLNTDPHCYS